MTDCTLERAAPAAPWKRFFRLTLAAKPARQDRRTARTDLERLSPHIRRDIGLHE